MRSYVGVGASVGVAMGAALGVALHDIPVWVTFGAACGVVFGLLMNKRHLASLLSRCPRIR